jgi:DNA-binding protein H-NS
MSQAKSNFQQATVLMDGMSFKELTELKVVLEEKAKRQLAQEQASAMQQIQEIANRVGLTMKDVIAMADKPAAKSGTKLEAKYRHPETSAEWSGHGRQPQWVKDWLGSGKTLQAVEIKP